MAFYRLVYNGADGAQIFPSGLKDSPEARHFNPARLDAFAQSCGHDSFDWNSVGLEPVMGIKKPLEELKWDRFWEALDKHPSLFNYGRPVFERRIEGDYIDAIVDADDNVISTISIIPKLTASLKTILHVPAGSNPQIYESGAAYIAEELRGKGIYTQLRTLAMESIDEPNVLVLNQTLGKGASKVNSKLGWNLVRWSEFPFAATLMGWEENDENIKGQFCLAAGARITLPEYGLYNGSTIDTASPLNKAWVAARDWGKNHHFWANKIDKLRELDGLIRHSLAVDPDAGPAEIRQTLKTWRKSVKHALFHDRELLGDNQAIHQAWQAFESPVIGGREASNDVGADVSPREQGIGVG